jgi:predicted MPP superfamily phosphohydrolase
MRRAVLIGAAGGAAGAALAWRALWHEPRHGRVRERELALPRWPEALAGLRVALVSDLHVGAGHVDERRVARIVAAVNAREVDAVLLLGDVLDGSADVAPEPVAHALGGLRARHGTAAVLGNHDWANRGRRIHAALTGAGIPVLEDEARALGPLWVAGVGDASMRDPDVGQALADVPDGAPAILLSHDPDVFPRVPARVALTVSGHTHGGQVAVPLLRRPFLPSRHGERFARGHVVEDGRHLYVTSGVGTSRWPVRLLAPPEVVVLRLTPA